MGGQEVIRPHCCLCVALDMLLLFPEPQFSWLYNGRVRENERDKRGQRLGRGEWGGGESPRSRGRDPEMEVETPSSF